MRIYNQNTPIKYRTITYVNDRTPEYYSWNAMRQRCNNPQDINYPHYGGRGITICKRWDSFTLFCADMGPRPKDFVMDRIDVNGNYELSNCRWVDKSTSVKNRRCNKQT